MKVIFLSLNNKVNPLRDSGPYADLLNEFLNNNDDIYIVCPIERRLRKKTYLESKENVNVLNVKIGNIQKTNVIEKGISTVLINSQFKSAINKFFKDVKFDLILYVTPPITLCGVIEYIKKRDNAKTYLMLKDIFPQNAVDLKMFSINSIFYKYFRLKEKKLYRISDYIGCMSPKNVSYVLKENADIRKEKVHILANSIKIDETKKRNLKLNKVYRKKYQIPLDSRVFIYGGNLGKPQGPEFIIKSILKASKIDKTFFLICGTGTEYKKIEDALKEKENILLINGLESNEYSKLLNVGDVGLIYLDYNFTIPNFPSRLLSYMEKAIPILSATDENTDIGDIIEKNNFGWKCFSNDIEKFVNKIEKIMKIPNEELNKLGSNSFNYLKNNYNSKLTYEIIEKNLNNINNK